MDPLWYRYGRTYAWLNAACYLAASLIFVLVNFEVTAPPSVGGAAATTAAELAARWAAISARERAIWWQLFASDVLYLVGMLALVPVGLTLRALFGGGARQELMAAGFVGGGALGALQTTLNLGLTGHTAAAGAELPADAAAGFVALALINGVVGSVTYWLLILFFLLVGLAMHGSSQLVRDHGVLPRGLGRLGLAVALLYWLAALAQLVSGLVGLAGADVVYQLTILVGGVVLAPLWSAWLGRELGRAVAGGAAA